MGGVVVSIYSLIRGDKLEAFLLRSVYKRDAYRNKLNSKNYSTEVADLKRLSKRTAFSLSSTFWHCLRKTKEKRMIEKAMARVDNELEIDHFIRT